MNLKEAARICRVSERSIFGLCQVGDFGAHKDANGHWQLESVPFETPALKPVEVAEILSMSSRHIEKLCEDGRIKAVKVGKQWRIHHWNGTKFILTRIPILGKWLMWVKRRAA